MSGRSRAPHRAAVFERGGELAPRERHCCCARAALAALAADARRRRRWRAAAARARLEAGEGERAPHARIGVVARVRVGARVRVVSFELVVVARLALR